MEEEMYTCKKLVQEFWHNRMQNVDASQWSSVHTEFIFLRRKKICINFHLMSSLPFKANG